MQTSKTTANESALLERQGSAESKERSEEHSASPANRLGRVGCLGVSNAGQVPTSASSETLSQWGAPRAQVTAAPAAAALPDGVNTF